MIVTCSLHTYCSLYVCEYYMSFTLILQEYGNEHISEVNTQPTPSIRRDASCSMPFPSFL